MTYKIPLTPSLTGVYLIIIAVLERAYIYLNKLLRKVITTNNTIRVIIKFNASKVVNKVIVKSGN